MAVVGGMFGHYRLDDRIGEGVSRPSKRAAVSSGLDDVVSFLVYRRPA